MSSSSTTNSTGCTSDLHIKLSTFKRENKYCDVTIRVQDKAFKCHRVILAAVSDYFDGMFGNHFRESFDKEITLHNISAATFNQILDYAYTGFLPSIGCDDVFDLLQTSEFLGASKVINHCLEHIRVNMDDVKNIVEIYTFVCATNKEMLIKDLTNHIVKKFKYFSENDELLGVPFEEFSMLLNAYQLPMVEYQTAGFLHIRNENVLLDVIVKWIHYLYAERRQYFDKLSALVDFDVISREYMTFLSKEYKIVCADNVLLRDLLADYFSRMHLNGSSGGVLPTSYETILNSNKTSTIHLLVKYKGMNSKPLRIFSLDRREPDRWSLTSSYMTEFPFADKGKCVVLDEPNNYLYFYGHWDSKEYSFHAHSSINLSLDSHTLTRPPCRSEKFQMCAKNHDGIYWYNSDLEESKHYEAVTEFSPGHNLNDNEIQRGIYSYSCELDRWFAMPEMRTRMANGCITADNNLLYLIGGRHALNGCDKYAQAYDHRAPEWFILPHPKNFYDDDLCCVLNGKIYVSDSEYVESYDPVAGKWEIISSKHRSHRTCMPHRKHKMRGTHKNWMVPFENKLWLFASRKDSLLQERKTLIFKYPNEARNFFGNIIDPYESRFKNRWCTIDSLIQETIKQFEYCPEALDTKDCNCSTNGNPHLKRASATIFQVLVSNKQ